MIRILSFFITLIVVLVPLKAQNVLDIEGGDATQVGIYIKSLADGKVIANENAAIALTPASVTKAITSATALNILGPDFCFLTEVILEGKQAGKGVWDGNLVIKAVGDPTIDSPDFKMTHGFTDSIVSGLKRRGITKITGSVVIREKMPDAGPNVKWEVEDLAWPYGAGLYGFNYHGNYVKVFPNTGKTVPASGLEVELRSGDRNDMVRGIDSQRLIIWGSPKSRQTANWSLNATVPDPANVYAELLKSRLHDAGISITDRAVKTSATDKPVEVYAHLSPDLLDICRDLMKRSDNLFAEGILRALLPGETREKCLKKQEDFWASQGLKASLNVINDGSGLTRANQISPLFLGQVLEKMALSEYAREYVAFFPVAGVDGTLKSFAEKTRLKGRLALKTGSVSKVQCYAGYLLDANAHPTHVVVVMVNGFFCSRNALRKKIEEYLLRTL